MNGRAEGRVVGRETELKLERFPKEALFAKR